MSVTLQLYNLEKYCNRAATDGASTKGIAGFDSAVFTVTGNGWVQLMTKVLLKQAMVEQVNL